MTDELVRRTAIGGRMSTHTPGPWTMDGRLVIDAHGDAVAMVNIARPVDVAHRDARLIAAAPELLAALRGMLVASDLWHAGRSTDNDFSAASVPAYAAIAKAEGT